MAVLLLCNPYFGDSAFHGGCIKFVWDGISKLVCLCWEFVRRFWFSFTGLLLVGVVFFPSLPFVEVMLFPSFVLGNNFWRGRCLSCIVFSIFCFSFFSSFPSPSSSSSSFLPPLILHLSFLSNKLCPSIFLLLLFSTSFLSFSFLHFLFLLCLFFFFEGTACTVCFQDVDDDATDCNPIVI